MQKMLNLKINSAVLPSFAPSVLRERVSDWFELDGGSPYMLLVADVAKSRRREMSARKASFSASTNPTSPGPRFRP